MLSDQRSGKGTQGTPPDTDENARTQNVIDEEQGFWNPQRVRLLAGAVIFMSFLMLAGFGLLIYKMVEKTLTIQAKKEPANKTITPLSAGGLPIDFTIDLNGFNIRHMSQSGRYITLHLEKTGSRELWVIDRTAKSVKQVIRLKN